MVSEFPHGSLFGVDIIYIDIDMYRVASKAIMVRDEIYDMMKANKLPGESFSDYLERLHRSKGGVEELFGAWADLLSDSEIEEMKRELERGRRTAGRRRPELRI
jgi:predicted CopG family antitoxin